MNNRLLLTLYFIICLLIVVACGSKEDHDSMHQDETIEKSESDIVRDYNVVVATLDKNGDGNVFQCPMDWQVISDETGSCPLCNMNLKEYSVADAQKNLEEHKPHKH